MQTKINVVLFKQLFHVIMLKLINLKYSHYHVFFKESQSLCSGTFKLRNASPIFDVTDAKFEFEFPEDLHTLTYKE